MRQCEKKISCNRLQKTHFIEMPFFPQKFGLIPTNCNIIIQCLNFRRMCCTFECSNLKFGLCLVSIEMCNAFFAARKIITSQTLKPQGYNYPVPTVQLDLHKSTFPNSIYIQHKLYNCINISSIFIINFLF